MKTTPDVIDTARLIVRNELGNVIIGKRSATAKQRKNQWEIFGGKVDPDELFWAAAAREFTEETGVVINKMDVNPCPLDVTYDFDPTNKKWYSRYIFEYTGRIAVAQIFSLTEAEEYKIVSIPQAIDMISSIPQQRALSRLS